MERRLIKYLKTNRINKIKKLYLSDPNSLLDRRGRSPLHIAAKYGSAEVLEYFINSLKLNPWRRTDRKGNYPLHYAIKYCLKHYSRGNVKELVNIFLSSVPPDRNVLSEENRKGTSLRGLLNALNTKSEMEDDKLVEPSLTDSSSNEEDDWEKKMQYEVQTEYSESMGQFDDFSAFNDIEENFDQMADRIYAEYLHKRTPKTKPPSPQPTPSPILSPPLPSQESILLKERDSYLVCVNRIFKTSEVICLSDLPFSITTPSTKISQIIFGEELSKALIRKELIRWHPDKFLSKFNSRFKDSERDEIKRAVDHISRSLIELGNR